MTEKCFDEGTLQAFLDGELDNDSLERTARHCSVCGDCARRLAEAEAESAFAFAALESELNSFVPTDRIRANLYETIAAENKPLWKKIFGQTFRLTNPSIAIFAGLILAVGIFTAIFIVRENQTINNETAKAERPKLVETQKEARQNETASDKVLKKDDFPVEPQIEAAAIKQHSENRAVIQRAADENRKTPHGNQTTKIENKNYDGSSAPPAKNQGLIGEESYLKTIAALSETVNSRKDEVLKPSSRISFEKDLAVVNDSIAKMQREVRNDPKNEAARELLRSSYQNKIDLLSSVTDKSELMATLR